ncbi:MAG: phosphoglycerate kinase, partial [Patescibacteria group bacterium]
MFTKKTIRDVDLHDKRVLMRADYNVPINDDGTIADDFRIEQSVNTIKALLDQNVKLVICSHLGRPEGPGDTKCSLKPIAKRLSELLGQEVQFADDCIGAAVEEAAAALQPGRVLLVENLLFHPQEEENDSDFAAQ